MKSSRYNFFVPLEKEGDYILYNTFSGAIFFVDRELKDAVKKNPSGIPGDILEDFKKEWVLLEDDLDELQVVSVVRDEMRFNASRLQFVIMTTYDCNLNCPYCYEKKDPMTSLTDDSCARISKFVERLIERQRARELDFLMYGGEPLLEIEHMMQLIRHFTVAAGDTGFTFSVSMTTNGTLLTPEIVSELEQYPVEVVQVTLDGPKSLHDLKRVYASGKGTYEDIIRGIDLLRSSSIRPKIRVNIDGVNKDHIPELLDDLKERGLSDVQIYYGIVRTISKVCESYGPSCMKDSEIKSVLPKVWGETLARGFPIPLKPFNNLVGCGMQSNSSFTIDPEGHVYKCVTGTGYPDQRIGTINEQGDVPAWSPIYYQWFSRNPLEFSSCRACTFFPLCGGGCPMIAYSRKGTYQSGGCFETKAVLKDQLILYLKQTYPHKFTE
ncbi:MAG: radical SAM protein [Theionarchaea archaeon]|nr:radical SAM protein [Theionarchaea archaeon]MBU7033808.1 radical SAM protein [Theionarchaea archaeon]